MFVLMTFVESSRSLPNGIIIFYVMAGINLSIVSFAALRLFGTVITEEKEQGTLGLLMITPMHPLSLISAKTIPLLYTLCCMIFIQVPLVTLIVTFGGVLLEQVLLFFLICFFHLLLVASICIPCSTLMKKVGDAIGLSLIIHIIFMASPPLLTMLNLYYVRNAFLTDFIQAITSIQTWHICTKILTSTHDAPAILIYITFCIIAFILSMVFTLHKIKKINLSDPTEKKSSGKSRKSKHSRTWKKAIIWKDWTYWAGGKKIIILKVFLYSTALAYTPFLNDDGLMKLFSQQYFENFFNINIPILIFVFGIEFLGQLSNFIRKEVKGKTLSGVLLQPISTVEFFFEKVKGALLSSLVPLCLLLLLLAFDPKLKEKIPPELNILHVLLGLSVFGLIVIAAIQSAIGYRKEQTWSEQLATSLLLMVGMLIFFSIIALLVNLLENYQNILMVIIITLINSIIWASFKVSIKHLEKMAEQEN
jgi:hypothetical protein